jgi:hypothetical protein
MFSEIKDLKRGTAEWASTVHSVRTQMYDILEAYPKLREESKNFEVVNGITVLSDQGWAAYEQAMLNNYYKSMQALYAVKIQETEL